MLLTVTLLLVACNDTDDIQKASEGLQYTFADDGSGFVVTGLGSCTDSEIVIPAVYQDKPVVKLAGELFRGKTYITDVILPSSLTGIGNSSFSGCKSLTSVTIPNSVTYIGYWAFRDCTSLKSITFQGTKAQWHKFHKESDWNSGTGNYTIHCTDKDITK